MDFFSKSCFGKRGFPAYRDAERSLRSTLRNDNTSTGAGGMAVYLCRFCNRFHVGHGGGLKGGNPIHKPEWRPKAQYMQ